MRTLGAKHAQYFIDAILYMCTCLQLRSSILKVRVFMRHVVVGGLLVATVWWPRLHLARSGAQRQQISRLNMPQPWKIRRHPTI